MRSGVPILEVLKIVSQVVGNVVMEKAIKASADDIERGEGISNALAKHPIFPTMVIRMLSAGEQTGNIDTCSNASPTFSMKKLTPRFPA